MIGDIGPDTDWRAAVEGIDSIVHLAARVHVMHDTASDSLNEYRRVDVEGTRRLALVAAEAGVRRFVFLSTIKVNGESAEPAGRLRDLEMEAEQAPTQIAKDTGMEWVILRPPLLYGPAYVPTFSA